MYVCVCVCVCLFVRERGRETSIEMLTSVFSLFLSERERELGFRGGRSVICWRRERERERERGRARER